MYFSHRKWPAVCLLEITDNGYSPGYVAVCSLLEFFFIFFKKVVTFSVCTEAVKTRKKLRGCD